MNDSGSEKIDSLISEMTLEEKASLCSGQNFWQTQSVPRLDIPAVLMTDGPHGVRKQAGDFERVNIKGVPATCFPTAAALANSWDRELLRLVGEALGEECLEEGVSVLRGPGVNIKRSPLCGRNFEYFSEDPLLSGELAAHWIGVAVSLTHDVAAAVRAFLAKSAPQIGRLLVARPSCGSGSSSVICGQHAFDLAESLASKINNELGQNKVPIHLFMAAPNAFTFFLGQRQPSLGQATLYEFDFEGVDSGGYTESLSFPI